MMTKRGPMARRRPVAAAAARRDDPAMTGAFARPLGWAALGAALAAIALLSLAGCSDDGADPAVPDPEPTVVSFAADIQPIFDANCLDCHGAAANGGLDLRAAATPGSLVNVASVGYAGTRVVPGDPHTSVLYLKVEGDASTGARMPFGRAALAPALRLLIHDWIEQGALDN